MTLAFMYLAQEYSFPRDIEDSRLLTKYWITTNALQLVRGNEPQIAEGKNWIQY